MKNTEGRHLYQAGRDVTECGLLRADLAVEPGAVHVTKARRSDCPKCRASYREQVKSFRGGGYFAGAHDDDRPVRPSDRRDLPAAALPSCGDLVGASTPRRVWIVVEEIEAGCDREGNTYTMLSAHASEASADAAVAAWKESHDTDGEPHPFDGDEDDDWCALCGYGVSVDALEVEDLVLRAGERVPA